MLEILTKIDVFNWQNLILIKDYTNKFNSLLYYSFNDFIKYCLLCDYLKGNIVKEVGTFLKKIEYKEYYVYNKF